jgi:hypothetical protein
VRTGWTSKPMMAFRRKSGFTNSIKMFSSKKVIKMPKKRFEVVSWSFLKSEIKGFNTLDEACIYYKKLPKHLRAKSKILFDDEVLI